jgi:hypothetical protein
MSEYVPSISGSKKTAQSLLTIEEYEVFEAAFSKLARSSRPINMKDVVRTINKEPKLRQLQERLTDRQMVDRVCTMRKAILRAENNKIKERKGK